MKKTRNRHSPINKTVPYNPHTSYESHNLCWQFGSMDSFKEWNWDIQAGDWHFIIGKMRDFEKMKWSEIKGDRNHPIKKENICPEAQRRLEMTRNDDIEEVFSLALGSLPRLIGIRDRFIFKILWWDPEHLICPSKKKHT